MEADPSHELVIGAKILAQVEELSKLPAEIEGGYKPPSKWVVYRGWREENGVLAKASRLVSEVRIARLTSTVVEAVVPSESEPGKTYAVKVYVSPLDFECSCPHGELRFNPCKHVIAVVLKLIYDALNAAGLNDESLRLRVADVVYEGLSKLAYIKARTSSGAV